MQTDRIQIHDDPFEKVITFGELKKLLPSTGTRYVPGIEQLKKSATVVLQAKTGCGVIKVYDNGFYTYTEHGCSTVYGVDRCNVLRWSFCNGEKGSSDGSNLDALPWEIPLEIAGSNRLDHNGDSRQESRSVYSLDTPASENNPQFSTPPEHEIQEEREIEAAIRKYRITQVRKAMRTLTKKQFTVLVMICLEKKTQEEVAEILGLKRGTVGEYYASAKKKFVNFMLQNPSKHP